MVISSKTKAELKFLGFHLDRINEAIDKGDSTAAIWWLERNYPKEFGIGGHWVNIEAEIKKKYPDLNIQSEDEVLSAVKSWESSALALQKRWPKQYGYRVWKPEVIYHNI
jgi:hypothetical protein